MELGRFLSTFKGYLYFNEFKIIRLNSISQGIVIEFHF